MNKGAITASVEAKKSRFSQEGGRGQFPSGIRISQREFESEKQKNASYDGGKGGNLYNKVLDDIADDILRKCG